MKNIFLFFTIVLLLNTYNSLKAGKEALIEFIKTTKDGKVLDNLSEQCFGKFFDYHFLLLKKYYKEENFKQFSKSLENIFIDIFFNCPKSEIISVFNETNIEPFSQLPFRTKIQLALKIFSLGSIIYSEYTNNNLTGISLGQGLGKILNLFKLKLSETNELKSDSENPLDEIGSIFDAINADDYFELIGGLFYGMKEKDDGKESKCYNDIIKGKDKIMEHIDNGFKKVDEGKGIGETITSILFNLITVEGLVVDCNLLSLGGSVISKLTSIKELTELFQKIMQSSTFYILYIDQIIDSFKSKNLKEVGKYIGKIISNIFDFNVQ